MDFVKLLSELNLAMADMTVSYFSTTTTVEDIKVDSLPSNDHWRRINIEEKRSFKGRIGKAEYVFNFVIDAEAKDVGDKVYSMRSVFKEKTDSGTCTYTKEFTTPDALLEYTHSFLATR
jgi:hypothetical protein